MFLHLSAPPNKPQAVMPALFSTIGTFISPEASSITTDLLSIIFPIIEYLIVMF
jgi:hypothetical protein